MYENSMAPEIDLEKMGIDYSSIVEPWKQEHVLDELINRRGYNYAQIGAAFEVDPEKVGKHARKHGVNPGYRGAYSGNTVPVGISEGQWAGGGEEYYGEYEIPLTEEITSNLTLTPLESDQQEDESQTQASVIRYMVGIQDGETVLHLDTSPAVEGRGRVFANERRLTDREGNKHSIARVPREVARLIGLNEPGDSDTIWGQNTREEYQMGRDATITVQNDTLATNTFDPALEPDIFVGEKEGPPRADSGARPESDTFTLVPLPHGESKPEDTEKYELDLPKSYVEAYDLEGSSQGENSGTPLTFTYGLFVEAVEEDGEVRDIRKPALIAEVGREVDNKERGVTRTVQSRSADTGGKAYGQVRIYPPKAGLHALGIGVGDINEEFLPKARIVPGHKRFALFAAEDQAVYDPLD